MKTILVTSGTGQLGQALRQQAAAYQTCNLYSPVPYKRILQNGAGKAAGIYGKTGCNYQLYTTNVDVIRR